MNKNLNVKYCSRACINRSKLKEDIGLFRKEISDNIQKYILGLFASDGCLTKHKDRFVMVISLKDEYMITKIRDLVCPTKKVYKDGNNFQVKWKNDRDVEFMNTLGITVRKTLTLPFINFADNQWDFIRGFFDGDGCVYLSTTYDKKYNKEYKYKYISFTCGSREFAEGLNKFLNDNGVKSKIYTEKRSKNVLYVKILNKKGVETLKNNMYAKEREWLLIRKYNIF